MGWGWNGQDIGKFGLIDNNAEVDSQISSFSNALRTGSDVITDEIQVKLLSYPIQVKLLSYPDLVWRIALPLYRGGME